MAQNIRYTLILHEIATHSGPILILILAKLQRKREMRTNLRPAGEYKVDRPVNQMGGRDDTLGFGSVQGGAATWPSVRRTANHSAGTRL